MSRRVWTLLGIGAIAVGLASSATAEPQEATKPNDLAAEVKALREKVAALEARLEAVEGGTPRVHREDGGLRLIPEWQTVPPSQSVRPTEFPPGTQERQFNGLTYYLMPVDGAGDVPVAAEVPVVTAPTR